MYSRTLKARDDCRSTEFAEWDPLKACDHCRSIEITEYDNGSMRNLPWHRAHGVRRRKHAITDASVEFTEQGLLFPNMMAMPSHTR